MPKVIDLVAELYLIAQNRETVCKALWDEELLLLSADSIGVYQNHPQE
jgi:hypothetical protein